MKSSLGPAALNFLNWQLQTGCSEFFERAAPSAKSASPPAARRKILNRTGGRGTHGSWRITLQCVRARRIFPSEQRHSENSQNLRRFAARFGVEAVEPRTEFSWCVEGRKISKEKSAARK